MTDSLDVEGPSVGTDSVSPSAQERAGLLGVTRRESFSRTMEASGLGLFLLALVIFFSAKSAHFLTSSNFEAILSASAVIGIVAIGQTLAIISGGFDLSVAGVIPLASVVYALVTNDGVPPVAAVVIVLCVGALVGLSNGLIITVLGIDPLITTLGMLSITGGIAYVITNGVAVPFDHVGAGAIANYKWLGTTTDVWLTIFLTVVGILVLRYTTFGRKVYATGGNREASWLAGIRVGALTTFVYLLCAVFAALAGILLSSQLLSGSGTLGSDAALTSIAAVVLGGGSLKGGIGGIGGTMVGVLILGVLANGMALMQVSSFYQTIATGAVLLLAVTFGRIRNVSMARRIG